MLSFTKKNNTHTTTVAQTVELASSSAAAPKESSSSLKKSFLYRASRRVQKMLGLKKTVVAQLAPDTRVVFELGPASDPYRNHARLSPSSSFAAQSQGSDHTRTTTSYLINRFSRYDSLLPVAVVAVPSSAACPALSPTSSFSFSLESKSLMTLEDGEVTHLHPHSTHTGTADADQDPRKGLTRADRVEQQPLSASRLHSTSSSTNSSSDSDSDPIIPSDFLVAASYRTFGPSSFPIGAVVPNSVTMSSFVGRSAGAMEGQGYSKKAVSAVRRGVKEADAERPGFVVSRVPVGVLEGEGEVVVEWM